MYYDLSMLTELCARWPEVPVPNQSLQDSLLERVRQVLLKLRQSTVKAPAYDLVALIRHVLLRAAGSGDAVPWLRVPLMAGWPTVDDWSEAQFDVLDDGDQVRIRPRWPRLSYLQSQADLFDDAFKGVESRPNASVPADRFLQEAVGWTSYTGDGQREAVRALLQLPKGETLIANLPTGSGKSVLAQLPPLVEPEGLMTLAIVPTVALAIDQASRMRTLLKSRYPYRELPPLAFYGGLSSEDRRTVFRAIRQGEQPILFTSPEFAVGILRKVLVEAATLGRMNRVVIDEAHLVIGWGNGFRPAFQLLPALVQMLRDCAAPNQRVEAVLASATLTGATIRDLRILFGPIENTYTVSAVHLRPEIRYGFQRCEENERVERVLEAVRLAPRPFILYVTRPEETDRWLRVLRNSGVTRVDKFSGITSASDRELLLNQWSMNELDGMVATSAFGLGVDKSDVRTVIHATVPDSLDRYYQEVGRVGRDGRAGAALMIHTPTDLDLALGLASPRLIGDEKGYERWTLLINHAKRHESIADVWWVELSHLPAHLKIKSEASRDWNIRVLTLMVRAGLIELVELASQFQGHDDVPQELGEATHAAIRILDDGHRNPVVFNARLSNARREVHQAAKVGFQRMQAVISEESEISDALREAYTVNQGVFVPVAVCCGGCPVHWSNRNEHMRYRPPSVPRLARFSPGNVEVLERLALPRASSNLLVIDITPEVDYSKVCIALLSALLAAIQCHTVALESSLANKHINAISSTVQRACNDYVFVDVIDAENLDQWRAGDGEVRIVIWGKEYASSLDSLSLSDAKLEILIVPSDLVDPHYPIRKFIDTTPHVHAEDLLHQLTS